MFLVTAGEMREMDRLTIEAFGIPGRVLMETAGRGATRFFLETFPDCRGKRVGVVAGRGNNGGDGFVMARLLAERGVRVTVFLLARKGDVRGDARANLTLLEVLNIPVIEMPDSEALSIHLPNLRHQAVWIDAILGTGLNTDVKTYFREVITFINESGKPAFSVDIPSGLSADTGRVCGAAIRAMATATFAFPKIGHDTHPGTELTGDLRVVDIGIPGFIVDRVAPKQHRITPAIAAEGLAPRAQDAHKGRTGHLLLTGGSPGKTGAVAMAAEAALRSGAGLVTTAVPEALNPVLEILTLEAMTVPLPDQGRSILWSAARESILTQLSDKKCLAMGPGLGTSPETIEFILELLPEITIPMVLDADALNCLAHGPEILKTLKAPVVLTPHPGEMARLTATDIPSIQRDRAAVARDFAQAHNCHVVLKGAGTVVAHPNGTIYINPTGNSGMAAGGMGDVLTGIIGGLMAQGASPEAACRAGVYLHGAGADTLALETPRGFLAREVSRQIPMEIQALLQASSGTSGWEVSRP